MKINQTPVNGPVSQPADASRTGNAASGKAATARHPATASHVALSPMARHLASLANGDNDVNIVRVNEIREALAAGTLQVNPERIADGLIDSARELISG